MKREQLAKELHRLLNTDEGIKACDTPLSKLVGDENVVLFCEAKYILDLQECESGAELYFTAVLTGVALKMIYDSIYPTYG